MLWLLQFYCKRCDLYFEDLVEREKTPECPECKKKDRVVRSAVEKPTHAKHSSWRVT